VSIVVPVYNEAGLIEQALRRVLAEPTEKEVIVVDDGSRDGTGAVLDRLAQALPIRVIHQPRNLGKGGAVRAGFAAARSPIVLIQDADLEYDPADYPAMIAPIERGDADAVMGSRFLYHKPHFFTPDGEPFFTHYIGNRVIIALTNLLYGFRATDYEGCYKAVARAVLPELRLGSNGFELDNELIGKLLRRRRRVVEVPIRYEPRTYRDGKKIGWRDGVRMVWAIVKWRIAPF